MSISLDEMAMLARALVDADAAVEAADEALKAAKEKARQLREETIPSSMQELGVEKLTLSTGQTITIKQEVYASIPADSKNTAYGWLEEHGFGGLIKTAVSAAFGKGELTQAQQLAGELIKQGFEATVDRSVHPQTLKAFLKEQLSAGSNVPLELFGARPVWAAKVTLK